jgi:hypothetical protein
MFTAEPFLEVSGVCMYSISPLVGVLDKQSIIIMARNKKAIATIQVDSPLVHSKRPGASKLSAPRACWIGCE